MQDFWWLADLVSLVRIDGLKKRGVNCLSKIEEE